MLQASTIPATHRPLPAACLAPLAAARKDGLSSPARERRMRTEDGLASDLALVRGALAGESEATQVLVQRLRFVPCALRGLNRRFGLPLRREDVDDLTQDTLALLWPRLAAFNGQSPLESWIYGFCVNAFMNAARKERRRRPDRTPADELEAEAPGEPEPGAGLEREALRLHLTRLPASELNLIRMRYYEDLTFDEIGRRLTLSPNTVKAAFYRALERLAGFMKRGREGNER